MSEATHTAGAWFFELDRGGPDYGRVRAENRLAALATIHYCGKKPNPSDDSPSLAEARANACLIRAAPDMLEALKHLFHWHDQLGKHDIAKAEAVIARAEGRTP